MLVAVKKLWSLGREDADLDSPQRTKFMHRSLRNHHHGNWVTLVQRPAESSLLPHYRAALKIIIATGIATDHISKVTHSERPCWIIRKNQWEVWGWFHYSSLLYFPLRGEHVNSFATYETLWTLRKIVETILKYLPKISVACLWRSGKMWNKCITCNKD